MLVPVPLVCVLVPAVTVEPVFVVPSKTLNWGEVVQVPPPSAVTTWRLVKCPATFATVEAITVLIAKVPSSPTPEVSVPEVAEIVSVIEPEEFVQSSNPVAGAEASVLSCLVTDVGA